MLTKNFDNIATILFLYCSNIVIILQTEHCSSIHAIEIAWKNSGTYNWDNMGKILTILKKTKKKWRWTTCGQYFCDIANILLAILYHYWCSSFHIIITIIHNIVLILLTCGDNIMLILKKILLQYSINIVFNENWVGYNVPLLWM